MLEFKGKCVIDIDLARSNINPREWALPKGFENLFALYRQGNFRKRDKDAPALIVINAPKSSKKQVI
jgi:hypothetical protein